MRYKETTFVKDTRFHSIERGDVILGYHQIELFVTKHTSICVDCENKVKFENYKDGEGVEIFDYE